MTSLLRYIQSLQRHESGMHRGITLVKAEYKQEMRIILLPSYFSLHSNGPFNSSLLYLVVKFFMLDLNQQSEKAIIYPTKQY